MYNYDAVIIATAVRIATVLGNTSYITTFGNLRLFNSFCCVHFLNMNFCFVCSVRNNMYNTP